ncbi:hypothetical protein LTR35_010853 [Friedmanniomyces endolithicus]|uniref:Glycosyltransferase family 34 protein n=1 Tax=Friedmanniomyces endolithicus TaxID=329885 RepID=A0AAN6IZM7_9PEZI|nr:hypothetical protein LTS00_016881 [Friedmanniomyces endolithicus]KAK0275583.1 hypothetical protein LTR35_010853 [Friedmanniomyces endolithicus]KAK0304280.1 hypothetical protein LTR82_017275 [Friedmanniomyces endolithicus]KAK0974687.1 hypothetical protein LTR54_016997 [Friedmanniomyces endolithicus]
MTPWASPRGRALSDTPPISPLTPLSPSALPLWLCSAAPKPGVLSVGRLKTYGLILAIILLGFWATAALGPGQGSLGAGAGMYDAASGGVLSDPSSFGKAGNEAGGADGMIGADDQGDLEIDIGSTEAKTKKPIVESALSGLHHAVAENRQSWNPYHVESKRPQSDAGVSKKTSVAKQEKPARFASSGEIIKDGIKEEDRLGARTRVGKCTIVFNGNSYWERALRTHEEHDHLHGYRLHVLRQGLLDDVWSKPAYILSLLLRELARPESERLEWLVWVDADTIILNPHVPIEVFLPPAGPEFDDVHLIYTNDPNGLNNGIFPIRVNRWAVDLFSAILSYRYYRPNAPLVFRDQSAMGALIQEPQFASHTVAAPQRWFNAYQGEHNELSPHSREKRMGYWLDRAEQHLDDWEIPFKSTSYPQEAKDFWNEQRRSKSELLSGIRLKATTLLTKTSERLDFYGARLTNKQRGAISGIYHQLSALVAREKWQEEYHKMEILMARLEQKSELLSSAFEQSHKLPLTPAHSVIVAGEKDLLRATYTEGVPDANLQHIGETVTNLKKLIVDFAGLLEHERSERRSLTKQSNRVEASGLK